ncbi:hypothetical protein OS493_022488 [Desmophyllum pertusum]|uniref:Uncharacterized protein n=1 Tax=Desmophyllum pertusum TaxID=174260 RepID=A0A9X0D2D7_9CNID|nr:hypothetical protein OS493_022488 [Desmophyllum pertusum]
MNFNSNVNPTRLCVIEGQQKLLPADSGTVGGLLMLNLEDGTALQLLQNGTSVLDGTNEIQKVDTIIGNGTSGTEDGLIDVARVSHPTGIIAEHGTIFFVDTSSKSVRLITRVSALIKYMRIMEDIYRTFFIHSDILGHAELPSLLKAEQRIEKAEKMLTQMLQNPRLSSKLQESCTDHREHQPRKQ